jgi:hypothetical protein
MKKLTLLLLIVVTLLSCGDDIEFNSPAMQGNKNGNLWRATSYASDIDFGGFLIEGENGVEIVQLVTQNDSPGTYNLGGESSNVAIFKDLQGVVYSTANTPDESLSVYPAEGQIIVEVVENTDPKTLTGSFWFYAYSEDGLNTVNFNEGVFYKVPLLGGLVVIDNGSVCLQATQTTALAANAFAETDTSMDDYTDLCNAYKDALMAKINACGDSSGSIQTIVDSLGNCIP